MDVSFIIDFLNEQPSEADVESQFDNFSPTYPRDSVRLLLIFRWFDLVDRWWERWATVSDRYIGSWLVYTDSVDTYRRFRPRLNLDGSDLKPLFAQALANSGFPMIEEIGQECEGPISAESLHSTLFSPTSPERVAFALDRFDIPIVDALIFGRHYPQLFPIFEGRIDFTDPAVREKLDAIDFPPASHRSLLAIGWRPPRSSPAFEEYRRSMIFPASVALSLFFQKWAKPFHLRYTIVV